MNALKFDTLTLDEGKHAVAVSPHVAADLSQLRKLGRF
jgi:hypothetical protein